MKNKKLGVFAVLSVLAITGVGVGVGVTSSGLLDNLVNATATANCTLTWDKNNAPTLETDGTGTSVAGHTELAYTGAVGVAGKHVGLKPGGEITQSDRAWDDALELGGKLNGIEEITVWYVNNIPNAKVKNPEYDPWGDPDDPFNNEFNDVKSVFRLRTFHNGTMSRSNTTVTSGVPIDLRGEELQANEFILVADVSGGSASDLTGTIDIEKIEIKCSMDTSYVVSTEGAKASEVEFFTVDSEGNRGASMRPRYINFRKGMQFAFKHKESVIDSRLTAKDFVITGNAGKVTEKKLPGEEKTTFFATFGESNVNINFKTTSELPPYAGKAFVGTYKLVNPKTMTTVDLVIDDEGNYTLGTISSGTYTLGADDMPVFKDNDGKSYTNVEGLKLIDDNFACLTYKPFASGVTYYYGGRGTDALHIKEYMHYKNADYGYHAQLTYNGATMEVLTADKDTLILDSSMSVTPATVKDFIGLDNIVMVKETHKTAENVLFKLANTKTLTSYEEVVGENTVMTAYLKTNDVGAFEETKIDKDVLGTFTCEGSDEILLDGFGGYIMGTKHGAYDNYGWTTHIVTIGGVDYQLDFTTKTYTEIVKNVNFLADGTARTYTGTTTSGAFSISFLNNNATFKGKTVAMKYDAIDNIVTVKTKKDTNTGFEETTIKLQLNSEDKTKITLTYYCIDSNEYYNPYDPTEGYYPSDSNEITNSSSPVVLNIQ